MNEINHRTRVGIERRQKMRMRLIESALQVFSEKGVDASVIDDVIVAAGVSRGTFYNYFSTNVELLAAVGEELSNEIMHRIALVVIEFEDPVERLATGLRQFLHTARDYPVLAKFVWRTGFNASSTGNLVYRFLPRHIGEAMQQGRLKVADPHTALDVILGIALVAIFSLSVRPVAADYPEQMVQHILLALGLPEEDAVRLAQLSMPDFPQAGDSLLTRVHARHA